MAGLGRWTSGLPSALNPRYPTNYNNPSMTFNVGGVHTHRNITNGIPHVFDSTTAASINNGFSSATPSAFPTQAKLEPQRLPRRRLLRHRLIPDEELNLGDWATLKFAASLQHLQLHPLRPSLNGLSGAQQQHRRHLHRALSTYRRMQFGVRVDF